MTRDEITRAVEAKRVRLAEVEARAVALGEEEQTWERTRLAADANGNERRLAEADARLTAIQQAKRRAAATVGKLREELAALDAERRREEERTLNVRLSEAKERARDALASFDTNAESWLKQVCLPEAEAVQGTIDAMLEIERERDRLAGRMPRVHPLTLDRLAGDVPGALGRLRMLMALARGEMIAPPPSGLRTMTPGAARARLTG